MASLTSDNDPTALLNFDPAAVAIRASLDLDTLEKLKDFANELTRYVSLVQETSTENSNQKDEPEIIDLTGNDDLTVISEQCDTTLTKASLSGPHTSVAANTSLRAAEVAPLSGFSSKGTVTTSGDEEQRLQTARATEQDGGIQQTAIPHHERKRSNPSTSESSSPPFKLARTNTRDLADRYLFSTPNAKQYGLLARNDNERSSSQQAASKAISRLPRKLARGSKGDLADSTLRHSVGRTRKTLNMNLDFLGLTANFCLGVISKRGSQRVSHITLSSKWNNLPRNTEETLEWWLGEGKRRINLASPLDPSKYEQPREGLPVFWARKQAAQGSALCHYIGHFRCIKFQKCSLAMKGEPRQALIEFAFVKFNESLAEKIASLK